jgi:hypothetical protein
MIKRFYQGKLIPWQGHHDIYACTPSLAMVGGDGMDLTLEDILSGAHGFLQQHPFVPGAKVRYVLRPRVGNVYPLREAPGLI